VAVKWQASTSSQIKSRVAFDWAPRLLFLQHDTKQLVIGHNSRLTRSGGIYRWGVRVASIL
jgi:hypothetical protein